MPTIDVAAPGTPFLSGAPQIPHEAAEACAVVETPSTEVAQVPPDRETAEEKVPNAVSTPKPDEKTTSDFKEAVAALLRVASAETSARQAPQP
ncbi:hypothetical protein GN244_ATG05608 [Phytophthora infestans]|nr:hypothetical protein GN244_ATG05608 [Phytophthora infestans]